MNLEVNTQPILFYSMELFLRKLCPLILFICLITSNPIVAQNAQWEMLFEEDTLDAFEQLNGDAAFNINKGVLVGVSKLNTPNSFLATKKRYSDFILEFEVMIDNGLNSGVQFRSNSYPEFKNGRVHGISM
jgi:hypothetical protein